MIAVIGDQHQNFNNFKNLIDFINKKHEGITHYIQVGDFGYMGSKKDEFLSEVSKVMVELGKPLYFIDGNHEDHSILQPLAQQKTRHDEVFELVPNVYYVPRGTFLTLNNHRLFFMGGAYSVDRMWRKVEVSYWVDEVIEPKDTERALAYYNQLGQPHIDVAITHDVPMGVQLDNRKLMKLPRNITYEADRNRRVLREILDIIKPKRVIHGHYHYSYDDRFNLWDENVRVQGLANDGEPYKMQYTII